MRECSVIIPAEEMGVLRCCLYSLLFVLSPLLAIADSTSPPTSGHQEGARPEDSIWTKNVSTMVDNCNWWNNFGDIAVGSPASEKLTFESVCETSLWGGLDINVFNKGDRVASVRAQFSFGHYMLIYDGSGRVLANFRESWGTMMFRSFYSVFYLYEGESDVLIARAERSTFLNSELKWFAAVKGQDCDDSDSHNNCVTIAVDEYKMTWQFLACAGYPWNFAWVNMPQNPAHRMAIQVLAPFFYFRRAFAFDLYFYFCCVLRFVQSSPEHRRSRPSRRITCCITTTAARVTGFIGSACFFFSSSVLLR